ncbi:MAG: hypothetical protein E7641_07720 [Ruminococcaceae bacterium]|nr:hypothetical protein [Oscillospiraceae bacterium]
MKKITLILALLLIFSLLASCNEGDDTPEVTTTAATTAATTTAANVIYGDLDFFPLEDKWFFGNYASYEKAIAELEEYLELTYIPNPDLLKYRKNFSFISDYVVLDDSINEHSHLGNEIRNYAESNAASEEFAALFKSADSHLLLGIRTPDLEHTRLGVCFFIKETDVNGETVKTFEAAKTVELNLSDFTITEAAPLFKEKQLEAVAGDGNFLELMKKSAEKSADFLPEYFVLDTTDEAKLALAGSASKEDKSLLFFDGESFTPHHDESLKEMENYAQYVAGRYLSYYFAHLAVHAYIPTVGVDAVIPFENTAFGNELKEKGLDKTRFDYVYSASSYVEIPIMNTAGEQGAYTAYIFLDDGGSFLAEILVKNRGEFEPIYVAKASQSPWHTSSRYINEVEEILKNTPRENIKGIGFDGEKYCRIAKE